MTILKIGGSAAESDDTLEMLFSDIAEITEPVILVHGGGKTVSELSRRLGIEPRFHDGVRVTSEEEMELVDMGLAGAVNTRLVRLANRAGLRAVGLTGADGSTLTGKYVETPGNRTGRPTEVRRPLLEHLIGGGWFPVVAPVASTEADDPVNINADEAAQALAAEFKAERLVFLSDIPGVLSDNSVLLRIDLSEITGLVETGVVRGGMTAKLRSCGDAIEAGVGRVVIGMFTRRGDLKELLEGTKGTTVYG